MRRTVTIVSLLALGALVALLGPRRGASGPEPVASAPTAPMRAARAAGPERPARAPAPARLALPAQGHQGEFVRQRHDYPPDTPDRLGPKIGRVLFDLETVVDMVSRGHDPDSEIARTRGNPLDADELRTGQEVLQQFFDEATPVVDAALDGSLPLDAAFDTLLGLRTDLNCRLMGGLALDETQALMLWPQMDGMIDEGCAGRVPKGGPEVIPPGHSRRGAANDEPADKR